MHHVNMTQIIKLCIYKRVFATYIKQCVPFKSNIQIIQTDTPFVILRKYPRFSIPQKLKLKLKTKFVT